jgi:sugar-specific transcriptional regulator TrmB
LHPLIELGLSGSEAAVYAYLVRHSPATGYKVAKAIGKPVANTYKTIASLEDKGAIVVDDSGSRLCRAIPPAEFLARLDKRYHEQRTRAAAALTKIERSRGNDRDDAAEDTRIYRLRSRQQVMQRARTMLGRATRCVLLDAFPDPLAELITDVDAAAARGVDVVVKPYSDPPLKLAHLVPILVVERTIPSLWPGHHLNLVIDAKESLLALLAPTGDDVIAAIHTTGHYLAAIQHSGLQFEFMMTHVRDGIYKNVEPAKLHEIVMSYVRFSLTRMPGYDILKTAGKRHANEPK